jgi:hypothetical protein
MGANPRARNADMTGVYYDANGDVACIVHADNDDFGPHQYAGLRRVVVPYVTYASASPAMNFKGRVKYHGLTKLIISSIQQQHPIFAAIVQNRVDAFDAWLADVDAKRTAFEVAWDTFWNALTALHKIALNNADTGAQLLTFVASLSAAERAAYDDMRAARQAWNDAVAGGPNP